MWDTINPLIATAIWLGYCSQRFINLSVRRYRIFNGTDLVPKFFYWSSFLSWSSNDHFLDRSPLVGGLTPKRQMKEAHETSASRNDQTPRPEYWSKSFSRFQLIREFPPRCHWVIVHRCALQLTESHQFLQTPSSYGLGTPADINQSKYPIWNGLWGHQCCWMKHDYANRFAQWELPCECRSEGEFDSY